MERYCALLIIFSASLSLCTAQFLISTCTDSQFRCNDGTCIDTALICNGVNNCPDRSDEDFVICRTNECRSDQFQCVYGACVDEGSICNGVQDCVDNSDELLLECRNETTYLNCIGNVLNTIVCLFKDCPKKLSPAAQKNYMKECELKEKSCQNGQLISMKEKCDGKVHCADGSDESLTSCATNRCITLEFRCKNGACVHSSDMCNGVIDCADGSDELEDLCHVNNKGLCVLPSFPNHGFYNTLDQPHGRPDQTFESVHLNYSCFPGYKIEGPETIFCKRGYWNRNPPVCLSRCALEKHQSVEYLCLPKNSTSQSEPKECKELVEDGTTVRPKCREPEFHFKGVLINMHCNNGQWDHVVVCSPVNEGMCSLPPFPYNGFYIAKDLQTAYPGLVVETVHLNYSCYPGYKLIGIRSPYCIKGEWSESTPECVQQCRLNKDPSVEYLCLPKNSNSRHGAMECEELVEDDTVVIATCRDNYYETSTHGNMHCSGGSWDYVKICSPQCGIVTSKGEQMVVGGRSAERGELPWHAGIYRTTSSPYLQICGGSLISTTVVISAAHCFWTEKEKKLQASNFAVAVGKLYRPYNNTHDEDAQTSLVQDIKIPERFQGSASNFQDDIALVIVTSPFTLRPYVRPVCVDFNYQFSQQQLHVGASGKVAGWGLTSENGSESPKLRVVELPYVEVAACIKGSPPSFYPFITSDKICAGVINGTARAVCKGDSGGGLVFLARERGADRYFLRGVVSTAPTNEHLCNSHVYTTFTDISKHKEFIMEYI